MESSGCACADVWHRGGLIQLFPKKKNSSSGTFPAVSRCLARPRNAVQGHASPPRHFWGVLAAPGHPLLHPDPSFGTSSPRNPPALFSPSQIHPLPSKPPRTSERYQNELGEEKFGVSGCPYRGPSRAAGLSSGSNERRFLISITLSGGTSCCYFGCFLPSTAGEQRQLLETRGMGGFGVPERGS